jgi:hypothetical protein
MAFEIGNIGMLWMLSLSARCAGALFCLDVGESECKWQCRQRQSRKPLHGSRMPAQVVGPGFGTVMSGVEMPLFCGKKRKKPSTILSQTSPSGAIVVRMFTR